ncbi:MAG: hypothetical protein AMXMBFR13_23840 [Phycisphaerae bacterium]
MVTIPSRIALPSLLCWMSVAWDSPLCLASYCLYETPDGHVWLAVPVVSLQESERSRREPAYRLSSELAKTHAPLHSRLKQLPADRSLAPRPLPDPADQEADIALVSLREIKSHIVEEPQAGRSGETVHEVTAASLFAVEFLSSAWMAAWRELESIHRAVTEVKADAPTEEKAKVLAEQITKANAALKMLSEIEHRWQRGQGVSRKQRLRVNAVNPEVPIVSGFRYRALRQARETIEKTVEARGGSPVPLMKHDGHEFELRERAFGGGYLYPDDKGQIWIGAPLEALGMIGVPETPPHRLAAKPARRLAPLVDEGARLPAGRAPYYWSSISHLPADVRPRVLVTFEGEIAPAGTDSNPATDQSSFRRFNEPRVITDVALQSVEFISPEWLSAWHELDTAIHTIVKASLDGPSEEKRKALTHVVEQGTAAVHTMTGAQASAEQRELVRKIDPEAKIGRNWQEYVERQWIGEFTRYVKSLRIAPPAPLPDKPDWRAFGCSVDELLAASESAQAFTEKVKASCPPETLDRATIYSKSRGVGAWEMATLPAWYFEKLRAEAKERVANEANKREQPGRDLREKWGLVLAPVDSDTLAEKLILRGALVSEVLSGHESFGLKAGDIIVDYDSPYDMVMAGDERYASQARLARLASRGGELRVLRRDRMLTVAIPKQ